MSVALKTHLPAVPEQDAINIGDAVAIVRGTEGFQHILDAIEAKVAALQTELLNKTPRETVGDYERTIGEMRGLASINGLVEGLIQRAEEAKSHG